jgi:hypothetical protein
MTGSKVVRGLYRRFVENRVSTVSAWCALGGLFTILVVACGSGDSGGRGDALCVPGQSLACVGPNACSGYQICEDDGSALGACLCSTAEESVGTGKGGAGANSALPSSSRGGAAPSTTGGASAMGHGGTSSTVAGATSTVSCEPVTMAGFTPPAYVAANSAQTVCTDSEIQQYASQCLGTDSCPALEPGGASERCGACLLPTPATSNQYGPIVETRAAPFYERRTNFAGCVELLTGSSTCAAKLQAAERCTEAACVAQCGTFGAPYENCVLKARSSVCAAYVEQAYCVTDSAVIAQCSGVDFPSSVVAVGKAFCGN